MTNDPTWDSRFDSEFDRFLTDNEATSLSTTVPARVMRQDRERCRVRLRDGREWPARVAGALRHAATSAADFPAVGDCVAIDPPDPGMAPGDGELRIRAVLPRRTRIARQTAGGVTDEQVIAANIDVVFVVSGLDDDFNVRRLERYLLLVTDSGADPAIILNKADLCDEATLDQRIGLVENVAAGAPIHAISAEAGDGLERLRRRYVRQGQTLALVGSSGVGKSTLVNALLGEQRQVTQAIKSRDGRGQHTTTHRELVALPDGALLVDTPGMKELQLWVDDAADASGPSGFDDVEQLAAQCRFNDCTHVDEPGCAVLGAIEDGDLDDGRLDSFHKLQRELDHLARKQDQRAAANAKARWKKLSKTMRGFDRRKHGGL